MHKALGLSLSLGRKKNLVERYILFTMQHHYNSASATPWTLPLGACKGQAPTIGVDREKICKGLIPGPNWKNIAMTHLPKVL